MLGAMLDLGVPQEVLEAGLEALGVHEFHLEIKKRHDGEGKSFTDVDVILDDGEKAFVDPYSGRFRNYGDIKKMIDDSNITSTAKKLSKKIFDVKAEAEARVHGVSVDQVQFHEKGAVDSIVDIVGTAIAFSHMDIDRVVSTHVPTGYGTIMCACGELPVPAPAVAEILEKYRIPHYRSHVETELLTPTGASFLAALVDEYTEELKIPGQAGFGYGTGKKDTGLEPLKLAVCEE